MTISFLKETNRVGDLPSTSRRKGTQKKTREKYATRRSCSIILFVIMEWSGCELTLRLFIKCMRDGRYDAGFQVGVISIKQEMRLTAIAHTRD